MNDAGRLDALLLEIERLATRLSIVLADVERLRTAMEQEDGRGRVGELTVFALVAAAAILFGLVPARL